MKRDVTPYEWGLSTAQSHTDQNRVVSRAFFDDDLTRKVLGVATKTTQLVPEAPEFRCSCASASTGQRRPPFVRYRCEAAID